MGPKCRLSPRYLLLAFLPMVLAVDPLPNLAPPILPVSPGSNNDREITTTMNNSDGTTNDATTQICGVPPPTDAQKLFLARLDSARAKEKRGLPGYEDELADMKLEPRATTNNATSISVNAYFHIVVATNQARYWSPTVRNNAVSAQYEAMNSAYAPAGIQFNSMPATYTIRDDWATDANSSSMKKALRQGTYKDLNIYFQSNLSSNPGSSSILLGYCTLPTSITYQYAGHTYEYPYQYWFIDGCDVLASTMPGAPNSLYGYNQGKTAVHESGHWFSLLHTFQGNTCDPNNAGDYISDTPQESTSTVGCPSKKDSCPNDPGQDPVHNYMDYSDDPCYTAFTPLQQQRMRDTYSQLRKSY